MILIPSSSSSETPLIFITHSFLPTYVCMCDRLLTVYAIILYEGFKLGFVVHYGDDDDVKKN